MINKVGLVLMFDLVFDGEFRAKFFGGLDSLYLAVARVRD